MSAQLLPTLVWYVGRDGLLLRNGGGSVVSLGCRRRASVVQTRTHLSRVRLCTPERRGGRAWGS